MHKLSGYSDRPYVIGMEVIQCNPTCGCGAVSQLLQRKIRVYGVSTVRSTGTDTMAACILDILMTSWHK